MPVTLMHVKRVQRLHDDGQHDRCDVRHCQQAHDEHAALLAATAAEEPPDFVDELEARVLRKIYPDLLPGSGPVARLRPS